MSQSGKQQRKQKMQTRGLVFQLVGWLKKQTAEPQVTFIVATALIIVGIYYLVFQRGLLITGDYFAEAYGYFLDRAVTQPWTAILQQTWEGNFAVMPALLMKLYVLSPLPFGYIDLYLRYWALLFAAGFMMFIALPFNRTLIKSDWLRFVAGVLSLLLINHVATFAIINIWYAAFVPILLVSLNPTRLSNRAQVGYVTYALLAVFTKPAAILVPFVAYRAWKTKEYVSGGVILLASVVQTYATMHPPGSVAREAVLSFTLLAKAVYYGTGVGLLKLIDIQPTSIRIALANLLVVGMFVAVFKKRGWLFVGVLAAGLCLGLYSSLLAPGSVPVIEPSVIFNSTVKIQRELITNVSLVLVLIFFVDAAWPRRVLDSKSRFARVSLVSLLFAFGVTTYRPVNVFQPGLYATIEPFRQSLTNDEPSCVPVAPTPSWDPNSAGWQYGFLGGCVQTNTDKKLDLINPGASLATPQVLTVDGYPSGIHALKTLLIPVHSPAGGVLTLQLRDVSSGATMTTKVKKAGPGEAYAPFNLNTYPVKQSYTFEVLSPDKSVTLAQFVDSDRPAHYGYFMGVAN